MSAKAFRAVTAGACIAGLLCSAACVKVGITRDNTALKLFKNSEKACFSDTYYELLDNEKNETDAWRHGMVSGNGEQGFISSGSPYADSLIFQNIHFVMPNRNKLVTPDSADVLDKVRQAVVKGEAVADAQTYDDVYAFHPGGALRLDSRRPEEKQKVREYLRYTDYETGEVGVYFTDAYGMWERKSFTSFADNAVVTALTSPSGSRINTTITFDDPGVLANFGEGSEADCRYKTYVSPRADCIAFIGHYPDYAESELSESGWATITYVLTDGGNQKQIKLERTFQSEQVVSGGALGIRIENAYGVYLITRSVRLEELGALSAFKSASADRIVGDTLAELKKIEETYSPNGYFDYTAALTAHGKIYTPQFNSESLTLGNTDNAVVNDALLKTQRKSDQLLSALAVREYCAARYVQLCCAGTSVPRLCGMWTGEFSPGWGGKYTMDANVNLQTASLASANLKKSVVGYANFILRQAPAWAENALLTHGFTDALQAPVNFDGDNACLTESCYSYPFRYFNAGAAWLLHTLYEALQAYGDMQIPLSDEFDLQALKSVLSLNDEPLDEDALASIAERGSLDLREEILLPLLKRTANYWRQLLSPAYYTDKNGEIHYKAGKSSLGAGETYCIVPGYSPENTPTGTDCPVTANAAIDIAACRDTINMLLDVAQYSRAEIETDSFAEISENLPQYLYDESGALKEWAVDGVKENNAHRHYSHLYCVWPLSETQHDKKLREAAAQALRNRTPENGASHALVHAALIAARLKDNETLTDLLLQLENSGIRYDSLLTNHDLNGGSAYCTDYALGYLSIINEALVYSEPGEIELLPSVPLSGFNVGSLSGLTTAAGATVKLMSWDLGAKFVIADITSASEQDIRISSPISDDEEKLHFNAGETKTVKFDLNIEVEAAEQPASAEEAETPEAVTGDETIAEPADETAGETPTEDTAA